MLPSSICSMIQSLRFWRRSKTFCRFHFLFCSLFIIRRRSSLRRTNSSCSFRFDNLSFSNFFRSISTLLNLKQSWFYDLTFQGVIACQPSVFCPRLGAPNPWRNSLLKNAAHKFVPSCCMSCSPLRSWKTRGRATTSARICYTSDRSAAELENSTVWRRQSRGICFCSRALRRCS